MNTMVLTGIAGVVGVLLRVWIDSSALLSVPTTTLCINGAGSLIAAVIATLASQGNLISADMRLVLVSGFCGGLTTFSALSIQSLSLMSSGEITRGLAYLFGSPIIGITFAFLGMKLATLFSS